MKLLFIIYNAVIESKVMEELEKAKIKYYTKIPSLQGVGSHSVPHLDSLIWPEVNHGLLIGIEEERKNGILNRMEKLKSQYEKEGLKVFVLPMEEVL